MHNFDELYLAKTGKRRRISSYDRNGGNDDRLHIKPNETRTFALIKGSGIIKHIWITIMSDSPNRPQVKNLLRKVYLSFYWDDEENPSVLAPIGDFFGMGHAMSKNYVSAPLQMSPQDGKGFNSWWPMPFRKGAKLTITNEGEDDLFFYFYVDYEEKEISEDALYFHALWRRECPTKGIDQNNFKIHSDWTFGTENTNPRENNYRILHAKGKGHYCGCNVNIHNLNTSNMWDWPGEGDDMIFIDGDENPTLYGTGTEDYVNMAWCPQEEYCAPYHGLLLGGEENWKGKISYYRYHIVDPIMFEKEIEVTIEHGHNNHRSDDWCTTCYWYQVEPHLPHAPILPVEKRMPVDTEHLRWTGEVKLEDL